MTPQGHIDVLKMKAALIVAHRPLSGCVRFGYSTKLRRWGYIIYDRNQIHIAQLIGSGPLYETNSEVNRLLQQAFAMVEENNFYMQIFNPKIDLFTGLDIPPDLLNINGR